MVSSTTSDMYRSDYHTRAFLCPSSLKKYIKAALKVLRSRSFNKKYKYDTIAFSGYSGAMIAIPLAQALGKELVLVRKSTDKHASSYYVEGYRDVQNYIIVDDFVCSGDTVARIKKDIKKELNKSAKYLRTLEVQHLEGTGSFHGETDLTHKDDEE